MSEALTDTAARRPHFLGTAASEDGAGVDHRALRAERRRRVLAAMAGAEIDALVLGRYPNVKYVVGHRSLWRAVLTASAPICVLVRSTGQVSLQASTWEDGIPAEVPLENLTGLTWNPRSVVAGLQAVEGLAEARRVAVDGVGPGGAALFSILCPGAEVIDAQPLLDAVRRQRLPAELHCIRTALAIAEGAMTEMGAAATDGASEHALKGRLTEAVLRGTPVLLASEPVACATPRHHLGSDAAPPLRLRPSDHPLQRGDLVAVRLEVLYAGYLGSLARTWVIGEGPASVPTPGARSDRPGASAPGAEALAARWARALSPVVDACRPGATTGDLLAAWDRSGEPRPPVPLAVGVGLGVEPPVVGGLVAGDDPGELLSAGMVLCIQGYVFEPGVGGYLASETVHIGEDGTEVLTRSPGGLPGTA
jgi:Xaa-Pro aminopeptidase